MFIVKHAFTDFEKNIFFSKNYQVQRNIILQCPSIFKIDILFINTVTELSWGIYFYKRYIREEES